MTLFRRIRLVLKSRLARDSGDAESALDDALARLDERLAEARGLLVCGVEEGRRLAALMTEEQLLEQRMLSRARQALQQGQDALAREAVKRSLRAGRQAKQYCRTWEQQQDGIARIQALLEQLEEKRADMDRRRQQLLMRSQLARARRVLVDTLYGGRGRWRVERAEDELITEELSAESYQELAVASLPAPEVFPEPMSGESVERTIRSLRQELGLPAPDFDAPRHPE